MKEAEEKKSGPNSTKIIIAYFIILAALGVIAWQLCDFGIINSTRKILARERDLQQTWMDKSLAKISAWRNEIVEQARVVGESEMIRRLAMETRDLSPKAMEAFGDSSAPQSPAEDAPVLAEQFGNIRGLLEDFASRAGGADARIARLDGTRIIAREFALPIAEEQKSLAVSAGDSGKPCFGPIRRGKDGLLMDMAVPLFETPGVETQKPIAIILLGIPLDTTLKSFLSPNSGQHISILPGLLDKNGERVNLVRLIGDKLEFEETPNPLENMDGFAFGPRKDFMDRAEVYSMGAHAAIPQWLVILETPASEVNAIIGEQKTQIYMLGALAILVLALPLAFFLIMRASRAEKERVANLARFNHIIRRQKQILSCINKSNLDGLLLVDSSGLIEVCNPAFLKMAEDKSAPHDLKSICQTLDSNDSEEERKPKIPLLELFPNKTGETLAHAISLVRENGKSATVEVAIPKKMPDGKDEDRLYRATIHPFIDNDEAGRPKVGGGLAIFSDITEFRRDKLVNDARQTALVSALGRAIESVDNDFVGHTDKMAELASLLGVELDMDKRQQETLRLAARLSQIGKLFVPREILTKKGKLTPEELEEIRRAPEYADKVLHDLHFDLPIRETIREMGISCENDENADGISLCGKALSVINAFIAMTSARAWRNGDSLDPQKAIDLLLADARFDSSVVRALGDIPPAALAKIIDGNS